jgi:hypothetical protein
MAPRSNANTANPSTAAAPAAPPSTALTNPADEAAALAALNASVEGDEVYDGFSESMGSDQFRLPRRLFNQSKGTDVDGNRLVPDVYYDPISQRSAKTIDAILIMEHTTRAFTTYDEDTEETTYICMSNDCVTGIEQATQRPRTCKGCPDAAWKKNAKGKRSVNCDESYYVLAVDMATREPFVILFRRTSASAIRTHVQRHHFGKRELPDGRKANMPLYWRRVRLSLELSENGKYAVPVIEVTGVTDPATADMCRETLDAYRSILTRAEDHSKAEAAPAAAANGGGGGGAPNTSFDPEDFDRS